MSTLSFTVLLCLIFTINGSDGNCKVGEATYNVGEDWKEESKCIGHTCLEDGTYDTKRCGLIGVPEGWTTTAEDLSKPFPDCCSHAVPPHNIVPDLVDKLLIADFLNITYKGDVKVSEGNELKPTQVKEQPEVIYKADEKAYYLLAMTDPDAPSREKPELREFLHWMVVNIPGGNIESGEVLAEYIGSGPPKGSGLHRYVFFLYKQPGKLTFDEPRITNTSTEHRPKFSIRRFAKKYVLSDLIAINVFQAQYDDYVPVLD